ncbi:MAG: FG-GAP repeat protein [Candidatus Latescibacterota bacterium]|nr:MAG: FG-GAP repeat protein [Candidatus Latescibacterota bacterium]
MSRISTSFVFVTSFVVISILCPLVPPATAQEFIEPDWFVEGDQDGHQFANDIDCAGDVNGDGYADIIIGWWLYSSGQRDQGAALVYYGGPSGPDPIPDWKFEGPNSYLYVGFSVAGAGDVNGDGYDDVLVGDSPDPFMHMRTPVNGAGDANYDACDDVLVIDKGWPPRRGSVNTVRLFLGGPDGLSQTPDWVGRGIDESGLCGYGMSMASAGDVNNDGYDDVIIGDPLYDDSTFPWYEGRAYVYYGWKRGISRRRPLIIDGAGNFASSVASAGDVNGDGYDDVIIGEPGYRGDASGRALVFFGFPGGLRRTAAWTAEFQDARFSNLGHAVAGAVDVNDDGYDDILVGQPYITGGGVLCLNPHAGRVYVFHGGPAGPELAPALVLEEPYAGCSTGFGFMLAGAGDVNGDGTSDVVVGWWAANHNGFNYGTGFIHFGSPSGLSATPNRFFDGALVSGDINATGAGDVDGDGLDDVLVGYTGHSNENGSWVGSAWLFLGKNATAEEVRDARSTSTVVLHSNYPNPFNPVTTIRFELQERMLVRIDVFDVAGKRVTPLCSEVFPPGVQDVSWAASNVASGVYFVRLVAGDRVVTRRMLLLK